MSLQLYFSWMFLQAGGLITASMDCHWAILTLQWKIAKDSVNAQNTYFGFIAKVGLELMVSSLMPWPQQQTGSSVVIYYTTVNVLTML